jgi:hypothetical protein
MSWYAVDALDDALSETESLLLPFDLGTWVRLAIIGVFAGMSPPQAPAVSWDAPPQAVLEFGGQLTDPAFVTLALGVAAVAVVIGVVFAAIGSVMEFVLVEVVRSLDVRLLEPFGAKLGAGLRLLAFRIGVGLVVLVAFAGVAVPAVLAGVTGTPLPLLALVLTVPLLFVVGVLAAATLEFTTAFVVPLMAEHGGGVLDGWRRFYPTLRAEWQQFGVYVLVKLVLLVGAGFVFGLAGAVLAVPIGLVFFAGAFTPVAVVAAGLAAVVGLVALAAVSVPVVTFLRYHSLRTLDASPAVFTLR